MKPGIEVCVMLAKTVNQAIFILSDTPNGEFTPGSFGCCNWNLVNVVRRYAYVLAHENILAAH